MTLLNQITPGWFATYGTTLGAGRDIDDRDTQGALPVALVNEAYVRKFLPDRNPIGETVTFMEDSAKDDRRSRDETRCTYPCVMEYGRLSTYR